MQAHGLGGLAMALGRVASRLRLTKRGNARPRLPLLPTRHGSSGAWHLVQDLKHAAVAAGEEEQRGLGFQSPLLPKQKLQSFIRRAQEVLGQDTEVGEERKKGNTSI